MNKRETGAQYEALACDYLKKQGFLLRELNFTCRRGEIDLIGFHAGYLVFTEVKYRKNSFSGTPEEAVSYAKQKKICRTADYYRMVKGYTDETPVRYDVVAIEGSRTDKAQGEEIRWHQNAFAHIY